jgi:hypothetical protein
VNRRWLDRVLWIIALILTVVVAWYFLDLVLRLLRADEDQIGFALALAGGAYTVLSGIFELTNVDQKKDDLAPTPFWLRPLILIMLQIGILVLLSQSGPVLFSSLAEQRYIEGIIHDEEDAALRSLITAQRLDDSQNVADRLAAVIQTGLSQSEISDPNPDRWSRYFVQLADANQTDALANAVLSIACTQAQTGDIRAQRSAAILARLDHDQASALAVALNNAALQQIYNQPRTEEPICEPPLRSEADAFSLQFLEIVRQMDEILPAARPPEEKSVTYTNQGWLTQTLDPSADAIQHAAALYEEALHLDLTNTNAAVYLSVLLSEFPHHFPNTHIALDQAIRVARNAQESVCQPPDTADAASDKSCYLLMIAEATARLSLDQWLERTGADADAYVEQLAERAITIAERRNHFPQEIATGEAYYLLALSQIQQGGTPSPETIDSIYSHSSPNNPRHVRWRHFADAWKGTGG